MDAAQALTVARSFAPLRPVDEGGQTAADSTGAPSDRRPVEDPAAIDPARDWRHRHISDLMRVPIGTGTDGSPIVLDLKESAAGGVGPHGLIVGATGSGKSELLRTLVTALAVRHSPEVLALLLVDFKGGATFAPFSALPHLTGMVTNLEDDRGYIDRFRDALGGELLRRQELLAAAGRVTSIAAYRDLRHHRPELEAVPNLLVIIDEFSELLGARPDLAELFVTVGRIGRSIGIHLLLTSDWTPDGSAGWNRISPTGSPAHVFGGRIPGGDGGPDAHRLPAEPGWGYLVGDGPNPGCSGSRWSPPRRRTVTATRRWAPRCHSRSSTVSARDRRNCIGGCPGSRRPAPPPTGLPPTMVPVRRRSISSSAE